MVSFTDVCLCLGCLIGESESDMGHADFFYSEGSFTVEWIQNSHLTMAFVDTPDLDLTKLGITVDLLKRDFNSRLVSPGEVLLLRRRTLFCIIPSGFHVVHVKSATETRKRKGMGGMPHQRSVYPATYEDALLLESLYPGVMLERNQCRG